MKGVARPRKRHRAAIGGRRTETADLRLAEHRAGQVLKADAVDNVLSRRQLVEQGLGGEIGLRQRVDEDTVPDIAKAVGRGDLDQHARRPVGAGPDHARAGGDVAGLDAVRDLRPVRREAQRWPRNAADRRAGFQQRAARQRRAAPHYDGHRASAVETRRKLAADSDGDSNLMRQHDDSVVALCRGSRAGTGCSARR